MRAVDLEARAERELARQERAAGGRLSPEEYAAARAAKAGNAAGFPILQPVDVSDLSDAEADAPQFIVQTLIPRNVVTLLAAHGGAGKSLLALTIAAFVATGRDWGGFDVTAGRALFVSLEDPGSLVRYRLRRIAEAFGLDAGAIARGLQVVDGTEGDGALAREEHELRRVMPTLAYHELAALAVGHDLIVIDNASDGFDANENDRRAVRAFVRMLGQLAREQGAGVLLLAHVDKHAARYGAAGNTYSGSTGWHNSARSRLAIIESDGEFELRHEKANLGPKADAVPLQWTAGGLLIPGERHATEPGSAVADTDAVLAALRAATLAGVEVGAGRSGPATAFQLLSTFDQLPARLKGPKGRAGFWAAVNRLQATGRVEVRESRTTSRHARRVLAEVEGPAESARVNPHTPSANHSRTRGAGCGSAGVPTSAQLAQTPAEADAYRKRRDGEP